MNLSIKVRHLVLDAIKKYGRGHIGSAFSIVEILIVLYFDFLNIDSKNPRHISRDRFILSKGHGCLSLYSVLYLKKFISKKDLLSFCEPNSILGGHPEYGKINGIEATTGSLGHGLPIGVGMALALKRKKLFDSKVVVILGDGELGEGSIWESFLMASKHNLNNLIIIIDYNKYQSYSKISEVSSLEPLKSKLQSFNLIVHEIDGHKIQKIKATLKKLKNNKNTKYPNIIIAHTIKGKGLKQAENNLDWHHKSGLNEKIINSLKKEIII